VFEERDPPQLGSDSMPADELPTSSWLVGAVEAVSLT